MKLISGTANEPLAQAIADFLKLPLTARSVRRFNDDEIFVEILENVRGEDVFVIQPTSSPANENIMELAIMLDALRRSSARRITSVMPYFGYARQDRKTGSRTPITAKLVANLLETAGTSRVLTVDLHAGQIQGFFEVPTDNLFTAPIFSRVIIEEQAQKKPLVVSPDVGGVLRARLFAERLGSDIAIIDKRRPKPNVSEVMNIIGEAGGRDCLLVDDIADSAGTLCNATQALMEAGARSVRAVITHGVLSAGAMERIEASALQQIIISDSIHVKHTSSKLRIVSIASLVGQAMLSISEEKSVSTLFD